MLDDIWTSVQSAKQICAVEERIQKIWEAITGSESGGSVFEVR